MYFPGVRRRGRAASGSGCCSGIEAASMKGVWPEPAGRTVVRPADPYTFTRLGLAPVDLGLDDLVEHQLATLDLVSAVVGEGRVAVGVDRVLAQHRVAVLDVEELLD